MPAASSQAGPAPAPRLPLGVRHPRPVLAVALVVVVVLGLLGAGVGGRLKSTSLRVPGTESARGEALLQEHFGESSPFAIMLEGPPAAIAAQGPRLVRVLRRDPAAETLSPWDAGSGLAGLRPRPGVALILSNYRVSANEAIRETTPALERLLAARVRPPLRVRMAGFASVARAIEDESLNGTRRGEILVLPILLIVLLLVFRSPIAAAVPLAFGGTTVIAARGLIAIATNFVDISGLALSIASMIGLALGVDYALLIVSRFREELEAGAEPAAAAATTRITAGRTTAFAGGTLLISILVAVFLVPGAMLASLCATTVAVIALAVGGPWIVGPALLVLIGRDIDRWRLSRASGNAWLLAISRGALRRPGRAVVLAAVPLLLLAAPALTLGTSTLTIKQLPPDNRARTDVEAIEAAVGGGWTSPAIVVAARDDGPVTGPRQLAELRSWQRAVARDPEVETVIGPASLARRVAPLRHGGELLLGDGTAAGAEPLPARLGRAGSAIGRLRHGLGRAGEGAQALTLGSARAARGSRLIGRGLSLAGSGGADASRLLQRFRHGAHLLADGQRSAKLGTKLLRFGIDELHSELGRALVPSSRRLQRRLNAATAPAAPATEAARLTVEKLRAGWRELKAMTAGAADPRYPALEAALREALAAAGGKDPADGAPYAAGYAGLPGALSQSDRRSREGASEAARLNSRLESLEQSAGLLQGLTRQLSRGLERLSGGGQRLAGGSDRIVAGARRLSSGLARLSGASERLSTGLERLRDGNATLGSGLSDAFHRTRPLAAGVRQAERRLGSTRRQLRRHSPRLFASGYFVLSALDGAPPRQRRAAAQAIDLAGGGQAAQMFVVSRNGINGPGSRALYARLRHHDRELAKASGMEVAVTGGVAQTSDYSAATSSRLPPLVLVITALTFLALVVILRALPLAAIAVVLNLLAVAAGFGVLALIALLPEGAPLGGVNGVDPVSAAGIFGVVFGISIDYAVFLLMRMRESWERSGDAEGAIAVGLERTATVIVGAATIMIVVFMVFATAPIVTIAQFGIGLSVAVLLDATVIRLVLLPSLMKLAGPRIWWLPRTLERCLPRLDVHGPRVNP